MKVLTFLAPDIWQKRHVATADRAAGGDGSGGLYGVRFTPPRPGVYHVFVQSRSQGLGFNGSPYVTLTASRPGGAEAESVETRNSHEE